MNLRDHIRDVPNFPKEGIVYFDITPLLADPSAFQYTIDMMAERFSDYKADKIAAAEARGFIFGAPLAYKLGIGFVPIRKPGKLPYKTVSVDYDLEYGTDSLSMHIDAVDKGEDILLIDDVLATGGTAEGMVKLVEKAGGNVSGIGFLVELGFLKGREKLAGVSTQNLLQL
ncbi:adenine phosphoribosyltransferase [Maridesulfovibrio hydrothermalis]|uniref:Adenine phosphoribosyltransferase n=1 Tax=Maridesulfovibrio hydrothermalis AM13 = DSM 14728 TaxID=1121451 RepID=L0RFC7_9BACT|nr:adenine phosphoribosyltransferase [Maridesulfovibrio hydrothermalis]CCO24281.1 Adenine phosphoribosyltransferase [Maridesulfovibrio hydrothermalis AM13 = DSM 14728]